MAQSSSYKQYNRTTRVLTEESGFAGGMLWTGNNIDETHLKAIVNCDYDDTTGYLKARDPFAPTDNSPGEADFNSEDFKDFNLSDYRLLGTYNISSFGTSGGNDDINYDIINGSGTLYIFTKEQINRYPATCNITENNTICIYYAEGRYYNCEMVLDQSYDVTLKNINASNLLVTYDNQLYGIGTVDSNEEKPWLHVYAVSHKQRVLEDISVYDDNGKLIKAYYEHTYKFVQKPYSHVNYNINSVNLLKASTTGFNAARGKNIASYRSVISTTENYIQGIFITDATGNNVIASPGIGETVQVRVATTCSGDSNEKRYMAMFQLKDENDTTGSSLEEPWTLVGDDVVEAVGEEVFIFNFKFQKKNTPLYFTYYGISKPDKPSAYLDSAVDYETTTIVAGDNSANLKLKPYNFSSANGTCVWRNRMCLWGVKDNPNTLFFSEVDDFYYYPVPSNVALFTSDIVNCIPYKNTLLVFTADKVYRMSENKDGSFTQEVVQNDMPLSKLDAPSLVAIKNMVLFKSKQYFYMIVPKSQSLTDELSVAPIYKNIAGFLNNLDKSVQDVLQLLYPEYLFNNCNVSQRPTDVYSEQDTVHILYDVNAGVSFKTDNASKDSAQLVFKLFLNYNTNLRAWTLYVEEITDTPMYASVLTEDCKMSFVRVCKEPRGDNPKPYFEIITQRDAQQTEDNSSFRLLLDTGYRKLSSSMQKRFREIQLKLHAEDESLVSFGTAFLVDGVWKRNYSRLEETFTADNTVSLMPVMDLNTFVTELSMPMDETGQVIKDPGSNAIELSSWFLDFSHFKREAPTTIRIPVSGKGYSPRFIFMAPEPIGLTINEINWVYRLMYGR